MNKTENRVFDEDDLILLDYLADLAAIAIENSSLNENLRKELWNCLLLYDFDERPVSNINIYQIGCLNIAWKV